MCRTVSDHLSVLRYLVSTWAKGFFSGQSVVDSNALVSFKLCFLDFPPILALQEQDLNANLERVQREMCHFDVS